MALLVQVSVPLPHTPPVPLTGQTLGALVVGATLGSSRGALSLASYILIGGVGAPDLAWASSGWEVLRFSSATGGYLVGMMLAAAVVGRLANRGLDERPWTALPTMPVRTALIYACGATSLAHALRLDPGQAWQFGARPFLVGGLINIFIATALLALVWGVVRRVRGQ